MPVSAASCAVLGNVVVEDQTNFARIRTADRLRFLPVPKPMFEISRYHGGGEHGGAVQRRVLKRGGKVIRRRGVGRAERLEFVDPTAEIAAKAREIRERSARMLRIGVGRRTALRKIVFQQFSEFLFSNRVCQHDPLFTGHTIYITSLSSVCPYSTAKIRATPCHPVSCRAGVKKDLFGGIKKGRKFPASFPAPKKIKKIGKPIDNHAIL
nr:MAG TPA: hypothetical protein [Caudoviricetes sp.]